MRSRSLVRPWLLVAFTGSLSCWPSEPHRPPGQVTASRTPQPDSLALRAPGGVEVWFTAAREAASSDGQTCLERAMEIRRGTLRIPVPLLYTGARPELVNDSTLRARIWLHCRPRDTYDVSLRTGRPTRVP